MMGLVNGCIGAAMLTGSVLALVMKMPRSRVRTVCNTLLFSMATENILLALGRSAAVWCVGGFLGWIVIPVMNASLDATMRLNIPLEIQGRVFAARNSLQFFTIPLGYFLGGWLVDFAFEPLMASQATGSLLIRLLKNMIHRTVHQGTMFHQQCNCMVVQFHELIVVLATVFCQRHVYDVCVR